MTRLIKKLLILVAIVSTYSLAAQDVEELSYSRFLIKAAAGNHVIGFPFENSFSAFNPSLSLGAELGINKSEKHRFFVSSNLVLIRNKVIGNTITSDIDFGYRFTQKAGLFIESSLSLGLLEQFHPRDIYQLDSTDMTYQKINDKGTFSSLIGIRVGAGYNLSKKFNFPIRIGFNHHFFIQTIYFDLQSFPIMPQSTTSITITYKFKKQ